MTLTTVQQAIQKVLWFCVGWLTCWGLVAIFASFQLVIAMILGVGLLYVEIVRRVLVPAF